jgi:hypothetical protein
MPIYENSVDILTNLWASWDTKQKTKILKARGLNTSWAQTRTISEMVSRGGGMIASDLLSLVKEYRRRGGASLKI